MTGAILMASGRVPKTQRTFIRARPPAPAPRRSAVDRRRDGRPLLPEQVPVLLHDVLRRSHGDHLAVHQQARAIAALLHELQIVGDHEEGATGLTILVEPPQALLLE